MSGALDIRPCDMETVRSLCERHHGYGSAGATSTYAFAVYEDGQAVAVYAWQPPPCGAAASVCPSAPDGVLSLSRMCAVPKSKRRLKHVSKPLRAQMKHLIDRTRWPVLVTFSDEGEGHTGYVYACAGWKPTSRKRSMVFLDANGKRASRYSNGKTNARNLTRSGTTVIQRWEHRVCESGSEAEYMDAHGWVRVPTGRTWRSGNPAFTRVNRTAVAA